MGLSLSFYQIWWYIDFYKFWIYIHIMAWFKKKKKKKKRIGMDFTWGAYSGVGGQVYCISYFGFIYGQ